MNHEKKSLFAGKGFYAVLFLCVAAVGISGYVLFFAGRGDEPQTEPEVDLNWLEPEPETNPQRVVTPPPAATVPPTQTPRMTAVPSPSAAPVGTPAPVTTPPPSATPQAEPPEVLGVTDTADAPAQPAKADPPKAEPTPAPKSYRWPADGAVTVPHSTQELIKDETMGDWRTHSGIDIGTKDGQAVYAAADGTVQSIADDPAWGTTVVLVHDGGLTSTYSNLDPENVTVTADQKVTQGTVLGAVGASAAAELAQPAHLHFEMTRDGQPIDPTTLLPPVAE